MDTEVIIILIIIACIFLIWRNSNNRKCDNNRKEQISSVKQTNIRETSPQRTYNTITVPSNNLQAIIIACSRKNGGCCVAAYDTSNSRFVRFVSNAEEGGEISQAEMQGISLLDIVEAKYEQFCPKDPQTENVLMRPLGIKRIKRYNGSIENIRQQIRCADSVSILDTTDPKLKSVQDFHHSLEIVKVRNLKLTKTEYNKIRASFYYKGRRYTDFRVTDPIYEKKLKKMDSHEMFIPSADIVFSIPLIPYVNKGRNWGYYKFVAAIYPLNG